MNNLKIDNNTVIHCETKQLAEEVCNLFHKLGYYWCDGDSYAFNSEYRIHDNQICYDPMLGKMSSINFYKTKNYTILPAVNFLKLHGYTIAEEEILVDFDVEKVKAGAKVVRGQKSKKPVRIVCYDVRTKYYPLIALVDKGVDGEIAEHYTINGQDYCGVAKPECDLFIIETTLKITPPQIKEMTLEEIEQQLGHKIKIEEI